MISSATATADGFELLFGKLNAFFFGDGKYLFLALAGFDFRDLFVG